jgi:hypothetical protein
VQVSFGVRTQTLRDLREKLAIPKLVRQYSLRVLLKEIPSYYKPSSSNKVAKVNRTLSCRLENIAIISSFSFF